MVNTSRTPGKHQIKAQQTFYIPKSRNIDAAKSIMFYSNASPAVKCLVFHVIR